MTCSDSSLVTLPGSNHSRLAAYGFTATDNVGVVNVSCTPPPNTPLGVNITVAVCIARDAAGNNASCTLKVTVIDNQPPLVTCPQSMSNGTSLLTNITLNFTAAIASDNVGVVSTTLVADSGGVQVIVPPPPANLMFQLLRNAACFLFFSFTPFLSYTPHAPS